MTLPTRCPIILFLALQTGEQHGSIRGVAADYGMDGRFRVDKDGIYQVTTTLNIHSGHRVDYARDSPNNFVEVRLYSNSKRYAYLHFYLTLKFFTT